MDGDGPVNNGLCEEPLSIERTVSLRGTLILLIVVFHCSFYYHFEFPDIGHIAVASFLFFSGYGLELSLDRKRDYLNGFLTKRVFGILVQYWVIAITIEVVGMLLYLDASGCFQRLSDALFMTPHWFVLEILVLYVLFFLTATLFRDRTILRLAVMTVSSFILSFMIYSHYGLVLFYLSCAGFAFGSVWYHIRKGIRMNLTLKISLILASAVILLMFPGRAGAQGPTDMMFASVACVASIILLTTLCMLDRRNGLVMDVLVLLAGIVAFVFTDLDREGSAFLIFASVATLILRSDILEKATGFIGMMSFDMYLIHETLYLYVWREVTQCEPLAFVLSMVLSVVTSYIVYRASGYLVKRMNEGMSRDPVTTGE